jgi:7-carboxy-7-deazaguanine synthase
MTYAVKEIFYTLQGEGANTGRPAVFLRFAGCNLWSGQERDRQTGQGGCARWCDTDFVGTDGSGGGKFRSAEALVNSVESLWPEPNPSEHPRRAQKPTTPFVVCTGGEPLLQLDEPLIRAFNAAGWIVAVETNGTIEPPTRDLWLTVSPKANAHLKVCRGNELKLVFPQAQAEPGLFEGLDFEHFFLQPLDGPNVAEHTERALEYCLAHPQWRLSLQTHKILRIP